MIAGSIALLEAPADDTLTDTTEDRSLPALAVTSTQTDLDREGAVQSCTLAKRVDREREEPVVYEGGITTDRVTDREAVVSDVVADVTGTGLVVAERVAGSGRYPFPFGMIAAQTGRDITQYGADVEAFAASFPTGAISDTWLVGVEDGDGVSMDYNDLAVPERAGEASVGLGFTLSWEGIMAEGVLYRSGYLAIYSPWTAPVFLEFVADAVQPHLVADDDEDGTQATLPGEGGDGA